MFFAVNAFHLQSATFPSKPRAFRSFFKKTNEKGFMWSWNLCGPSEWNCLTSVPVSLIFTHHTATAEPRAWVMCDQVLQPNMQKSATTVKCEREAKIEFKLLRNVFIPFGSSSWVTVWPFFSKALFLFNPKMGFFFFYLILLWVLVFNLRQSAAN